MRSQRGMPCHSPLMLKGNTQSLPLDAQGGIKGGLESATECCYL